MLGWTPGLLHSWTVHWEPTLSQDRPAINRTCTQLRLAVPGKLTKLHLLKKMIQAQVSNSGPHLGGRGQLLLASWQVHQITFTQTK